MSGPGGEREWRATEEAVRAALANWCAPDGSRRLEGSQVGSVAVEGDWIAVGLNPGARRGPETKHFLEAMHEHLTQVFPGCTFELRTERRVHRGGAGFGAGRHVVAVLGGKGGVGKSTLSVNLALTLSAMGHRVGLLDGDLNGPDIPHMLGIHPREEHSRSRRMEWSLPSRVTPPSERLQPVKRLGLEVMSVGFVVPERAPLTLTSRWLVAGLLRNMIFETDWQADVLVLDAPPGTGEELQVMAQELPLSGAVFVTTPQDLAQMDAGRTLSLLREHGVPIIGVVQNMASLTCPHCQRPIDLFARSSRLEDEGVRVLGRLPFDTRLAVTADKGTPLVLGDPRGPVAYEFARIGSAVRRWLAETAGEQRAA